MLKRKIHKVLKCIVLNNHILRNMFIRYYNLKSLPYIKGMSNDMISYKDALEEAIGVFEPNVTQKQQQRLRFDIIGCYFEGKFTPEEYFLFDFKNKSKRLRKQFVSRIEKDSLMENAVGLGEAFWLLKDKYKFYNEFKDFFCRDVCKLSQDAEQDFIIFCEKHKKFIAKSNTGRYGNGTEVCFHDGTTKSIRKTVDHLLAKSQDWIIEEVIEQDDRLKVFNPTSINTVRICSHRDEKEFFVFEVAFRTGRYGSVVDNLSGGGYVA